MSDPVTRQEQLLSAIAAGGDIISPVTREEMYLAYMAGDTSIVLPEPVTRKEQFLYQACLSGDSGGAAPVIQPISITENGTYEAPDGVDGYSPVTVDIGSGVSGSATLWGRPYVSGSFTLAEDTSVTYEIGDFSDWLNYTSDNGFTVTANYNIVAFLWRDVSAKTNENSTLFCGAYQAVYYNGGSGSTAGSCGLGKNTSSLIGIKNGGIYASGSILQVRFTTTFLGYAGDTYHWLVTKVMV